MRGRATERPHEIERDGTVVPGRPEHGEKPKVQQSVAVLAIFAKKRQSGQQLVGGFGDGFQCGVMFGDFGCEPVSGYSHRF